MQDDDNDNFSVMATVEEGIQEWRDRQGRLHRVGGPAQINPDLGSGWYRHDQLHREDGPAIEFLDGTKEWYQNDKRHRLDGPAVEKPEGAHEWWIEGRKFSVDAFLAFREELRAEKTRAEAELEKQRRIDEAIATVRQGATRPVTLRSPFRFKS